MPAGRFVKSKSPSLTGGCGFISVGSLTAVASGEADVPSPEEACQRTDTTTGRPPGQHHNVPVNHRLTDWQRPAAGQDLATHCPNFHLPKAIKSRWGMDARIPFCSIGGPSPRHPNPCRPSSSACQYQIGRFAPLWVRPPGTTIVQNIDRPNDGRAPLPSLTPQRRPSLQEPSGHPPCAASAALSSPDGSSKRGETFPGGEAQEANQR